MENQATVRPTTPQKSKSFTRLESPRSSPLARSRASTLQNGTIPENGISEMTASPLEQSSKPDQEDIFEKNSLINGEEGSVKDVAEMDSPNDLPEGFDELPIELISLIDR